MRTALVLFAAAMIAGISGCNLLLGNDAAALDTGETPAPAEPVPGEPAPADPAATDTVRPEVPVVPVEPVTPVVPPNDEDAGVVTPDAASPCPAGRKPCFGVCVPAAQICAIKCEDHRADCNGDPDDGCEVKLQADNANCGGCGLVCAPGTLCKEATCKKVGPK